MSVLKTMSLVPDGVKIAAPDALKEYPFEIVVSPLNVEKLFAINAPLRVEVPVPVVNVFVPVTDVFPFKLTLPVPVEKVEAPV